ncbi:MAG: hypothetical protein Q9218_006104 [Villophora microphyllina]
MALKDTSVLVIGGCGVLGHHVVSELLTASAQVSVIDLHTDRHRFPSVTYYGGDITDTGFIHGVFEAVRPDAVIHTASPVVAEFAGKVAMYEKVNILGTRSLLEAASQVNCIKVFIYTSSASVTHDGVSDLYMSDENDPILSAPQQKEPHNLTKGIAEELVLRANRHYHGMLTSAIRPVSMFGEGDVQQLPNMLQVYYDRKTNVQIGDNTKYFDFVYVGNVADAHILALKRLLEVSSSLSSQPTLDIPQAQRVDGEAFLVTNDQPFHFWDYARTVWAAAGDTTDPKAVWVIPESLSMVMAAIVECVYWLLYRGSKKPVFSRQKVVFTCMNRTFSIAKIKKRLGYQPRWSIEEGVKRGVVWFQHERDKGKDKKDM